MTISHPRIEVKDVASAGWFGASEEAKLPVRWPQGGSTAAPIGSTDVATRESAVRAWLGRLRRALVDILIVVAAMTTVPVLTVSAGHGEFWQSRFKLHFSQFRAQDTEVARAFMVPVHPTITPLEAGHSYLTLLGPPEPTTDFPTPSSLPAEDASPRIFTPRTMLRPDSKGRMHFPSSIQMLAAAPDGFSSGELDYFRALATRSSWRDFDRVARAPAIDVVGGRFRLPFLPSATVWNMPVVRGLEFSSAADLAIRRAAYHLAIGQRDSAETVLRLIVSFGVHLSDNAPTVGDQFAGRAVTYTGMEALEQYYVLTHDPRAATVRAWLSNAGPIGRREYGSLPGPEAVTAEQVRHELIRRADDPHESRGIRFASLEELSMAPCTNVRELLFGASPDVRDAFERAKRDLARYPSERAFIDMIQRTPNVGSLSRDAVLPPARQFLVGAATIAGAVLRNPRLSGCTLIATEGRFGY